MKGCTYESQGTAVSGRRTLKWATLAIAAVLMFLTAMAGTTQTAHAALIDNWVCGRDLGWNTSARGDDYLGFYDGEQLGKYSMLDLYGNTLAWTTYNGTPNPENMKAWFPSEEAASIVQSSKTLKPASEKAHRAVPCGVADVNVFIGNMFLWVANLFSQIASAFTSKALDPSFICQDPTNTQGEACINLLAVIAGDGSNGSDGGIIGRLYSGMYLGLVTLAIAAVGIWAAWTGLAKRKLTQALGGIAGAVAVFGIGVALMANPLFLAELPMRIGTTVGGCVVMGASGANCMNPSSTDPNGEPDADTVCLVDTSKEIDISRYLSLLARSQTCKVWKAFVVEPWTVGQFGTSYDNLDLDKGALSKLENTDYKDKLTVSMYSSDGTKAGTCSDGNTKYQYNNLALYQLNVMSTLHACGRQYHRGDLVAGTTGVYSDWAYIADIMSATTATKSGTDSSTSAAGDANGDNATNSSNDSAAVPSGDLSYMWTTWTGQWSQRIALGAMAMLMSFIGGWILITTAVMAMMYLFVSVILTTFSPLFFLAGIVPGRGRKILLGWVEQMVSSILKYFACILWMIVIIELYGSVLGNSGNIGLTFTFCLLVTLTMWCYRGEFVSIIGRANFGGTQFSDRLGQWWGQSGRDMTTRLGATAAAGIINPGAKPEPLHAVRDKNGKIDVRKTVAGSFKTIAANAKDHANMSSEMMKRQLVREASMGTSAIAHGMRAYSLAKNRRDHATMQTATASKSALIGEAGKLRKDLHRAGYTSEQIDGIVRNGDMTAAAARLTEDYNDRIKPTKEGISVIDGIIADRNKARAEADTQIQQAATQPETADTLPLFRDYDGDLQGDLKAWNEWRDANARLHQLQKDGADETDAAAVKATMDRNLERAKRISDLRTATRQRIDSDALTQWNRYAANAGMKPANSINGLMAQGNQFRQTLASEQRRYDRDMRNARSLADLQTVQNAIDGQRDVMDNQFAGQYNGHLHTTDKAVRQTNLLADAVNDHNGDSMADRLRARGLGQATGTQTTSYAAMNTRPENKPKGRHAAGRTPYGDKFGGDMAKQAKGLGIRTRTYARLQSQGHSADQIRASVSSAIKAYPHVSRDEALNKYFTEGPAALGNNEAMPKPDADTLTLPKPEPDVSNATNTQHVPEAGSGDNIPTRDDEGGMGTVKPQGATPKPDMRAVPEPVQAMPKPQAERVQRLREATQQGTAGRTAANGWGPQTERPTNGTNARTVTGRTAGVVDDAMKTAKVVKAVGEVAGVIPVNPMDIAEAVTAVASTGNGGTNAGNGNKTVNDETPNGANNAGNGNRPRRLQRPPKLK